MRFEVWELRNLSWVLSDNADERYSWLGLWEALEVLGAWHLELPRNLKLTPVGSLVHCYISGTVTVPSTGTLPKLRRTPLKSKVSSNNLLNKLVINRKLTSGFCQNDQKSGTI